MEASYSLKDVQSMPFVAQAKEKCNQAQGLFSSFDKAGEMIQELKRDKDRLKQITYEQNKNRSLRVSGNKQNRRSSSLTAFLLDCVLYTKFQL